MTDIKKIRNYVRARKQEIAVLDGFDAFLNEVSTMEAHIKGLRAEATKAENDRIKAEDSRDKAQAAADAIIARAKDEATQISRNADNARKEADEIRKAADETLAVAKAKAADLEAAGRQRGLDAAQGKAGELAAINAQVAEAEKRRDDLSDEIEALYVKRQDLIDEINRIRSRFD